LAHHTIGGKFASRYFKALFRGYENMTSEVDFSKAARNVLHKSLDLRQHQNLLIISDPGSLDVAELITETAQRSGILAAIFFVPLSSQTFFNHHENLPLPVEAAMRETDAVLNLLSASPETMAYRRRILRTSCGPRVKVAHCPGMTMDILGMVDVDYELIRHRCNVLATALALGKRITISTTDMHGDEHLLEVEISGWEYPPSIGDGLIPDGAWANLPPGETFTIPMDSQGSIVINGSMPGRVLEPGEELILTVGEGRLLQLQPEDSPAGHHLLKTQIDFAKRHGDLNWSNLAEIGFGVNPAIERLTGIPLIDEKKDGTVHIALGDSGSLGGAVDSAIHCDLMVEKATVTIDGKLLLDKGRWQTDQNSFLPDYRTTKAPVEWWRDAHEIRRSGVRTERLGDQLVRYWNSGPGRWDYLPVGTTQTAHMAALLQAVLPEQRDTISREKLLEAAKRVNLNEESAANLLWIMCQYDLVLLSGA